MSAFTGIQSMNMINNDLGTSFLNINVSGQAEVNNLIVSSSATLPSSVFPSSKSLIQYSGNLSSLLAAFSNTIGAGSQVGGDINSTTEIGYTCSNNLILKNLRISCRFNSITVNGNLTFTLYKATGTGNYAATSITTTLTPVSNTIVNASDLSNSVSFSAGDRFALKVSSGGGLTMAFSLAGSLLCEV